MEEWLIQALALAGWFAYKIYQSYKESQERAEAQRSRLDDHSAGDEHVDYDLADVIVDSIEADDGVASGTASGKAAALAPAQQDYLDSYRIQLAALRRRADLELTTARADPATMRVACVLADYVVPQLERLQSLTDAGNSVPSDGEESVLEHMGVVVDAVLTLIGQRQHPLQRDAVGDADAIASACYEPLIESARARGIKVSSSAPVTLLGDRAGALAIWVGFLPTGIAPLFLPPDFFRNLWWWPGLAHEMAHDFLAASEGMEPRLRYDLQLPPVHVGARWLELSGLGITVADLHRVFGVWFEELFCDVFGTLMLGPAYLYSMVELFKSPQDPSAISLVPTVTGGERAYATHPPRHLRVLCSAQVLRLASESEVADEVVERWMEMHQQPDALMFPVVGGVAPLPAEPVVRIASALVHHLYAQPLAAFGGHSLSSMPGIDWGPHAASESRRVRDLMLAGQVPDEHAARFVVAGAVMALRRAPERHYELLSLARKAIVGVGEHRNDDAYALPGNQRAAGVAGAAAWVPDSAASALILDTLLGSPRCQAGMGMRRDRGSVFSRRGDLRYYPYNRAR